MRGHEKVDSNVISGYVQSHDSDGSNANGNGNMKGKDNENYDNIEGQGVDTYFQFFETVSELSAIV